MKRIIMNGSAAAEEISKGIDDLEHTAGTTLGPGGRATVIGSAYGKPSIARKGGEVAKSLSFRDVRKNTGVILLRTVGDTVAGSKGDGSVQAMVMAQSIIREGKRLIAGGYNPVKLRRGIEKLVPVAVQAMQEAIVTNPGPEMLASAAAVTTGDEALGKLIAEAVCEMGTDGIITVKASETEDSYLRREPAFKVDRGWTSKYMATDETTQEAEYTDVCVFLYAGTLMSVYDILPLLNEASIEGARLLVVAEDYNEEVTKSFVSNLAQGVIKLCAVTAPGVGPAKRACLEDIAAITGATVFGTELFPDAKKSGLADCGRAKRVKVTRDASFIYEGQSEDTALQAYISTLERRLQQPLNELEEELLRKRAANLKGKIAELKIGAVTEAERICLTRQAEGGIKAMAAAARGGVLPGGGVAFFRAIPAVTQAAQDLEPEERPAGVILQAALEAPLRKLAENSGYKPSVVVNSVREGSGDYGLDLLTGEYGSMLGRGIIDAAPVLISAFEAAAGAAGQFLTVDGCVLIDGMPISDLPVPDNLNLSRSDFM